MPYQENRNKGNWFTHTAGVMMGAAVIFTACDSDTKSKSPSTVIRPPSISSDPTPFPTRVPLMERPLSPDILKRVQQSLVTFSYFTKPGYEHYKFPAGFCNGFIINDSRGKLLVVTAKHCFPEAIESEADDKLYSTIGPNGENILNAGIEDINGRTFEAFPYNNYTGDNEANIPDVMLFQVPDDAKFNLPALSLNLEIFPKWTTLHRVSIDNNKVSSHPLQFLERLPDQDLRFFSVTDPELACYLGTSGSPVMNNEGEVVALATNIIVETINENVLNGLQLERGYLGKKYALCGAEDSNQIKGLIRNQ